MSDMAQYAEYFTVGMKITVCIPMRNNEQFRDWATVEWLEDGIITLQLSRDRLPVEVSLFPGLVLDLRIVKNDSGFRCAGVYAGKGRLGIIQLQLTGDVGTSELREFFRIDAFLPFRYQFSEEQNLDVLIGAWRKKKKFRLEEESGRREDFNEKCREKLLRTVTGELSSEELEQAKEKRFAEEFNPIDESWDYVSATALNLSAGGIKFVTTDNFKMDELVTMEMFIPVTPPRIMECIARVIFINDNYSFRDDKKHYNVALNFVIVDDRDRDAIVSHISYLESLHIRQKRQLPIHEVKNPPNYVSPIVLAAWLVFVAIMIYLAAPYVKKLNLQNEIGEAFGNAVKKYREQTGQKW